MGGHTILGSGEGGHEANGGDDERMHGDSVSLGCVVKADVRARAGVYCRGENENEGVWWWMKKVEERAKEVAGLL